MAGLNPESNELNKVYLDHNNFHIYVETMNETTGKVIYTEWKRVYNLVMDASYNDQSYELRLNEDKDYTIKFGDNVHGVIPPQRK